MKLKSYKKTIEENKITFTVEFELPEKPTDEDEATKFAVATILSCSGITPADLALYPPIILSTIRSA